MLVLSRKPGQSFFIGDDIQIVITDKCHKNSSQVRVGIIAPDGVKILRTELKEKELLRKKDNANV